MLLIKGVSLFAFEKEYSITSKLKLNTVKTQEKTLNLSSSSTVSLYNELKLNKVLEFEAFSNAVKGLNKIKTLKKNK